MIEERPLPWQELLEILFRRWMVIVGCALLGVLLTGLMAVTTPPQYTANAKILLTEQAVSGPREDAMSDTQIKAELHHLKSPALVREVLELYQETGQPLRPEPPPLKSLTRRIKQRLQALYGKVHEAPPTTNLDWRVQELAPKITPRSIAGTNVIDISLKGSAPEWTARFINDLVDQHIKRIAKFNEEARASNFLIEQRNLLFVRWKDAQQELTDFRKRHGADLLSGDDAHLRKVMSQLEADRVETDTRVLENQAKVDYLTSSLENLPGTIAAESTITESERVKLLKQNILALEMKRSELLSRYTPASARVTEIEMQIQQARTLLTENTDQTLEEVMTSVNPAHQSLELERVQTEARLAGSQARADALDAQIENYRAKLNSLEILSTELQRLRNEVENREEAHQNYLLREEEARFSSSLDESGIVNLAIFERAEPPVSAEPSGSKLLVGAGAIAGLVLGLILAVAKDFVDPTVKGSAQAFRLGRTPIIAEIPRS